MFRLTAIAALAMLGACSEPPAQPKLSDALKAANLQTFYVAGACSEHGYAVEGLQGEYKLFYDLGVKDRALFHMNEDQCDEKIGDAKREFRKLAIGV